MTAPSYAFERRLDGRRVTAMTVTFAAHALAVALVALPIAIPALRPHAPVVEAILRDLPEPPPPAPPEPVPPPRALPRTSPRAPTPPAPHIVAEAPTVPAAPAIERPTSIAPPVDSAPGKDPAAVSTPGETRTLAYDGALKLRYPIASLRRHEQGLVYLRVLVDAQGRVERVEVARSSGHPALDAAAIDSVKQAHFKPVLQDGKAMPAWGTVPIEFRVDRA